MMTFSYYLEPLFKDCKVQLVYTNQVEYFAFKKIPRSSNIINIKGCNEIQLSPALKYHCVGGDSYGEDYVIIKAYP